MGGGFVLIDCDFVKWKGPMIWFWFVKIEHFHFEKRRSSGNIMKNGERHENMGGENKPK